MRRIEVHRLLALTVSLTLSTFGFAFVLKGGGVTSKGLPPGRNCTALDNQRKAKATWNASSGGREQVTARASSPNDTFALLNENYELQRATHGLIFMGIACSSPTALCPTSKPDNVSASSSAPSDCLLKEIAEGWAPLATKRVAYAPPAGSTYLTWLTHGPTAACTGGTPSGSVCAVGGSPFTQANSTETFLLVAASLYQMSLLVDYASQTPASSRRDWHNTVIATWAPILRDHFQQLIMDRTWRYAAESAAPCPGPAPLSPYGGSQVGLEQMYARYAARQYGTGTVQEAGCNAIRDADLFLVSAAAEYLRANLADPTNAPYSGSMGTNQMKGLLSVVNKFVRDASITKSVSDFAGASKTGRVFQPFAYDRQLLTETGWAADTNPAFPPNGCPVPAPGLSTSSATMTAGSALITVPSTANIVLRSRLFNVDGSATGIPDNGSISPQAYFVGEINSSTTFTMYKTVDFGHTVSPGAANFTGTKGVNLALRAYAPAMGAGEDTSHMGSGFFFFLTSLRGLIGVAGILNSVPDAQMVEYANQFAYGMSNKDLTYPRFTNYQSGMNGWFRAGYSEGGGYPPWESGTLGALSGWGWFGSFNPDVAKLMSRWKVIWEATSGPDYEWRVANLMPGGGKWARCVYNPTATLNLSTNNPFAHQLFYPSITGDPASSAQTTTVRRTSTIPKQATKAGRSKGLARSGSDPCPLRRTCLFAKNPVPTGIAGGDDNPITYGFKFSTRSAASVTHIRFYSGAGAGSIRTVRLFSVDGSQLASVETRTAGIGWRNVALSPPVPITVGANYVAAVDSDSPYPYTYGVFNSPIQAGILTAPSTGVTPNGVFGSLGVLPDKTFQGISYGVDVAVVETASAAAPASHKATSK